MNELYSGEFETLVQQAQASPPISVIPPPQLGDCSCQWAWPFTGLANTRFIRAILVARLQLLRFLRCHSLPIPQLWGLC